MLEKPDLQDEKIITCLQDEYGLAVAQLTFLPIGADPNTAVYRAATTDETAYFVKLRRGAFDETSVTLPKLLSDQGVAPIIPPLATQRGQLWANLDVFTLILYPFVAGRNGYEVDLSDQHWVTFGAAVKRLHTAPLPPALLQRIQPETYSPHGRQTIKMWLDRLDDDTFVDAVAVKLAAFLRPKREQVLDLVDRAERLAQVLQARPPEFVVCHSDLHAGNILIGDDGAFYIVDWDNPILACKERDLMFSGGGQGFRGHTPQKEETLFYQGYGPTQIDPVALAYYRYERIVQDIAIFCEQIFLSDEGGEDREQSLRYLASNFLPNGILEITYQADKTQTN